MEDSQGHTVKGKKLETYPATLEINGEIITIVDTLSFRFMVQNVEINTKNSPVQGEGGARDIEVSASIVVHLASDGRKLICMKDELFYPKGEWIIIKDEGYVYDRYASAIEDYKELGYGPLFGATKKTMEHQKMVEDRNLYIISWWLEKWLDE